jgi:hypothetical protein
MNHRWRGAMLVVALGALAVAVGILQGSALGGNGVPKVSSVKPAKGEVGDDVLIKGVNFVAVTTVKFDGKAAAFTIESSKRIHATVPVGATSGPISVLTAAQKATSKDYFKVRFDVPFKSCLTSGSADVPVGTFPYVGVDWVTTDQSFAKPFRTSTKTTLTVNGIAAKNAARFWDKQGEDAGAHEWRTYWGYDPERKMRPWDNNDTRLPRPGHKDIQ